MILELSSTYIFFLSCNTCNLAKINYLSFHRYTTCTTLPLQLVHSDVWGPLFIISNQIFKYYILFVDDWSKYCWDFPMHLK